MTRLYWDCSAGIAGNMAVASLLAAGVPVADLEKALNSIPFEEGPLECTIKPMVKSGISAMYFNTVDDEVWNRAHEESDHSHGEHDHSHDHEPTHQHDPRPDHDHPHDHAQTLVLAHEHGHPHSHQHPHTHHHTHKRDRSHSHSKNPSNNLSSDHSNENTHSKDHSHVDDHSHAPAHHASIQRGFVEIRALIEASGLPAGVKSTAIECFRALGEAEAAIHGAALETIHFHEVGGRDSIADLVGAAFCLHELGVTEVFVSPINVGSGFTKCHHGRMPIPAPATSLLLRGFPVFCLPDVTGELTTPTGAALLRGLGARPGLPAPFVFESVGTGCGTWDLAIPNILRAFLGKSVGNTVLSDSIVLLTTNLDNVTGELLGHVMETLMTAGALDVAAIPVLMKKQRPGYQLEVMVGTDRATELETLLFQELPTLGIRRQTIQRSVLARESVTIDSPWGPLQGKRIREAAGETRDVPEFDELRRVAREQRLNVRQVATKPGS